MPKTLPISEVKARLLELKATLEVLSDPELMEQIRSSQKFFASGARGVSFEAVFGEPLIVRRRRRRR